MKKAPQIARLSDEEALDRELAVKLAEAGFFRRIIIHIKSISWHDIKHLVLVISEKVTRQARLLFVKLESKSRDLNTSIRKTKNKHKTGYDNMREEGMENMENDDIINKINNYQPADKKEYFAELKKTVAQDQLVNKKEVETKIIRPTVSDRVVTPKARVEMKDRLEDLLIERIAANPKDTEAYERLGEYYMEIDSLQDAKECFKQVLKLDPKNANVKYRMRRLETIMHKR
jgi:tetratricopeptide (TPR) repeat protein